MDGKHRPLHRTGRCSMMPRLVTGAPVRAVDTSHIGARGAYLITASAGDSAVGVSSLDDECPIAGEVRQYRGGSWADPWVAHKPNPVLPESLRPRAPPTVDELHRCASVDPSVERSYRGSPHDRSSPVSDAERHPKNRAGR
jgi:hypothetical protein